MEKFKNVVNSNTTDKVAVVTELLDGQWNTMQMLQDRASIMDASVRAKLGAGSVTNSTTYSGDTLDQIYNLQLPTYMGWDYWLAINQWVLYWVNRNEIEADSDVKLKFKLALSLGRKYGQIAIHKENESYAIGTLINPTYENGELVGGEMLPSFYANKYGYLAMNKDNKTIELADTKDKDKLIKVSKENTIFFVPRETGIGDFVYCMKDILIDIYLKTMISSNASNLQDKMYAIVNNKDTLPVELWINRNPFKTYGVVINDAQSGAGTNEYKFSESKGGEHAYINTLIETLKHHQEYYYAKYGRPITSNKAQSLSSDSSLSISSAEAIARDWDERVEALAKEWTEKFHDTITIVKPELDTPPMNQNADKLGLGKANTEGDVMEKQAEAGK